MKKWWIFVAVLLIIIIAGVVALVVIPAPNKSAPANANVNLSDTVVVNTPTSGAKVQSPLTVSGKARGSFYFEAGFPVIVAGPDGNIVAQGQAQAQGNWQTNDFVPFTVTLTFRQQPAANTTGTLILLNDNPSGDPAKQITLKIPVTF